MELVVVLLLSLMALGAVAALCHRLFGGAGGDAEADNVVMKATCDTCNGENALCEQECMMEAATREIEYYDDEDLDDFRGRTADSYSDDEADVFREILYTLAPQDVKGWNRSLILRGISVPDQIKDELILMIDGNS